MSEMTAHESVGGSAVQDGFRLSPQQLNYFHTFGYLKLPGLFKNDIQRMTDGFEEVYAKQPPDRVITEDPLQDTDNETFQDRRRSIIYNIVDKSDNLRWLTTDPRILAIVNGIVGENWEARPTDGHIFHCDTSWHPDMGSDNRFRLKLSFYLDRQRADSGAIRLIPGSQFYEGEYAKTLLDKLYGSPKKVKESLGIEADTVPCSIIETDPGDLLCWNFRTFHATFHGFDRRRLFSMTYCAQA
jgi:hypothetical protein